jgi:hypothetical protein
MNFLELVLYTEGHQENDEKDTKKVSDIIIEKFNNILDIPQTNNCAIEPQHLSIN